MERQLKFRIVWLVLFGPTIATCSLTSQDDALAFVQYTPAAVNLHGRVETGHLSNLDVGRLAVGHQLKEAFTGSADKFSLILSGAQAGRFAHRNILDGTVWKLCVAAKKDMVDLQSAWRELGAQVQEIHDVIAPHLSSLSTLAGSISTGADKFSTGIQESQDALLTVGRQVNNSVADLKEVCNSRGNSEAVKLGFLNATVEHLLAIETFKTPFTRAFREATKAFTKKGDAIEIFKAYAPLTKTAEQIGQDVHDQVRRLVTDAYYLQVRNRDLQEMA